MWRIVHLIFLLISIVLTEACRTDNEVIDVLSRQSSLGQPPPDGTSIKVGLELFAFHIVPHSSSLKLKANMVRQWKNPNLAFENMDPCNNEIEISKLRNELWTPEVKFINADDTHRDKNSIAVSLTSTGLILHSEKLSQTVPCKTQVSRYPFGNTTCVLQWAGGNSPNGQEMTYAWEDGIENEAAIKVSDQVGDLILRDVIANSTSTRMHGSDTEILQLIFQFQLESKKILLLFFLPMLAFLIIAWLSLLLGPMAITRSIIVCTSSLMLLLHYNTNSASLPSTNGITSIDVWKLFSIIFILIIYCEIVLVTLMASLGRSRRCQRMCCCGSKSKRKGKYTLEHGEPIYEEMNDLRNRRTRRTCGCCRYSALFVDFFTFWTLGVVLALFTLVMYMKSALIVKTINEFNMKHMEIR